MQEDLARPAQFTDGSDILNDANLVVDVHQADQDGVVTHGGFQLGQADEAIGLGLQIGNLEAIGLQVPAGIKHRLVFGLAGDDMLALLLVKLRYALDGQVVGLGGAGGEDNLPRRNNFV